MQDLKGAERPPLRILEPDETVHTFAPAVDSKVLVTDRRLAVIAGSRVVLDIPFERLRRVQFDIERDRPATLVLVPEQQRTSPRC